MMTRERMFGNLLLAGAAFGLLVAWRNQTNSTGLVFPSPATGKRLDNIRTSWANLMKAAAIENFDFHDTRHHFASRLVMAGIDIVTVKELLGHASLSTTQIYTHVTTERMKEVYEGAHPRA